MFGQRYTRRFETCVFECFGMRTVSTFNDGHVNDSDFTNPIMWGTNSRTAYRCGYAGAEILYYWEHDFVHHWIADRKGEGPSWSMRHGDAQVSVKDSPLDNRYEETLVHYVQSYIRKPEEEAIDLLAWEGWDPTETMEALRADIRETFGGIDMGIHSERWWTARDLSDQLATLTDYWSTKRDVAEIRRAFRQANANGTAPYSDKGDQA